VPVNFEGSGKDQCNLVVTPGKIGQPSASDSSQTVMTYPNSFPDLKTSNTALVLFFEMSIPISPRTSIANGFNLPGSRPALSASKNSPHLLFSSAAAI